MTKLRFFVNTAPDPIERNSLEQFGTRNFGSCMFLFKLKDNRDHIEAFKEQFSNCVLFIRWHTYLSRLRENALTISLRPSERQARDIRQIFAFERM